MVAEVDATRAADVRSVLECSTTETLVVKADVTVKALHVDGGALAAAGWYRAPNGTWTNVPVISGNGFNF
ncbi:hypothetical protein D3C87_1703540 [compost metagenome]